MPNARTGRRENKSAFVRSLPPSMPAREVVERARKKGISLIEKYVHVIRSNAKRKGAPRKAKRRRRGQRRGQNGVLADRAAAREFVRLALELGLKKSESLLAETKSKLSKLVAAS